ncbi:UNKNOWN [Stylonychia lemnae]|uniref:Uncharacterized protein n=1 Tax=Stylonychia lemnae TaxID=5949 RepID=A0A078ATA7_STYLE|nr:UNKNOWN [Stylonychia lemnae]|eukprot:CDW85434.1 UNKNOWN [Stylonychia lemnae]
MMKLYNNQLQNNFTESTCSGSGSLLSSNHGPVKPLNSSYLKNQNSLGSAASGGVKNQSTLPQRSSSSSLKQDNNKNQTLKKNSSQVSLTNNNQSHQAQNNLGIENYFNAKSQMQQSYDLVKEIPSMRSFACSVNEDSSKEIEKHMRGKLKIDQAMNRDRIFMPQDSKGLVMLYGGGKEERRRQNSKDSFERSLEGEDTWNENRDNSNHFKRRSFSMQTNKLNQSKNQRQVSKDKSKQLSTSIFGGMGQDRQKVYEISSYKRDAALLLANRMHKKLRGYFAILTDFAAFQEFNINEAFEDFKNKQDQKSRQSLEMRKESQKLTQSQGVYSHNQSKSRQWAKMTHGDNFLKDINDNIFLSQDKMSSTYQGGVTSNVKIKIQNNSKDHTPVNIFQTYLKQNNNVVSPIPMEAQQHDFYDLDTVDDLFDFKNQISSRQGRDNIPQVEIIGNIKNSFKNKVENLKSDFNNLLNHKNQKESLMSQDGNQLIMSQRNYQENKENDFNLSNNNKDLQNSQCLTSRKPTTFRKDQIQITQRGGNGSILKPSILNQRKNLKILQQSREDNTNSRMLTDNQRQSAQRIAGFLIHSDLKKSFQQIKDATNMNQMQELSKIHEKLWGLIQYKELKHKFMMFFNWKQHTQNQEMQESLHISHISGPQNNQNTKLFNKDSALFNTQLFDEDQQRQISSRTSNHNNGNKQQQKMLIAQKILGAIMIKRSYMIKTALKTWKQQSEQKQIIDEEASYKQDLLRQVISQMIQCKMIKGFRTWKDAAIIIKEQEKYNKVKGSQQIMNRMKTYIFKSLFKSFLKWKTMKSDTNEQKGKQIPDQLKLKLSSLIKKKHITGLRQSFNALSSKQTTLHQSQHPQQDLDYKTEMTSFQKKVSQTQMNINRQGSKGSISANLRYL